MELSSIKDYLLAYFSEQFDHSLITDQTNNPFLTVSLMVGSQTNPHRDSFSFYVRHPDKPATHTIFTTSNIAAALALEAKYLLQKPSLTNPVEDVVGCTRGVSVGKYQILLITIITPNLGDAKFVCNTVINKSLAYIGS